MFTSEFVFKNEQIEKYAYFNIVRTLFRSNQI